MKFRGKAIKNLKNNLAQAFHKRETVVLGLKKDQGRIYLYAGAYLKKSTVLKKDNN